MKMFIVGLVGIIIIAALSDLFFAGKKGRGRFDSWRKGGKGMLDDFDQERKDLDNLMK